MKIKYNAPVVLTYSIISICVTALLSSGFTLGYLHSPAHFSPSNPHHYIRLVTYIFGHAGWHHLTANLVLILLLGPMLEEKHGSGKLVEMILVTAIITALLNAVLFSSALTGGSGIAFMLIILSSFSNIRKREIPLTFIIIAVLFIGSEVAAGLRTDSISQFSHLAGAFIGAGYGFFRSRRQ